MSDVDALIIGSGPNGLVAAAMLAQRGWSVLVCESNAEAGGGVRSSEATLPGFVHDHCAGFFPLTFVSEALAGIRDDVTWHRGQVESAHPRGDGTAVWIGPDAESTAASLEAHAPGDGDAWMGLVSWLRRIERPLYDCVLSPFPNIPAAVSLGLKLRIRGGLRLAHLTAMTARDLAMLEFAGPGAGQIIGGLALHSDLGPEEIPSGVFGLILAYMAQTVGFPVPEGGAGSLSAALMRRVTDRGGEIRCGWPVVKVVVKRGRAAAVVAGDGTEIGVRRAVVADTGAPALFHDLVGPEHLPARFLDGLRRFRYGVGVFKVDWALSAPVPWTADACRRAATVHVGDDIDDLSRVANQVLRRLIPSRPYLVLGQQSLLDPTRAPAGAATLWGYTHAPSTPIDDADGVLRGGWAQVREGFADRIEERIEEYAPGFRSTIRARRILDPTDLERDNANLVGGEINGGTGRAHQQLVFRPAPGWFRYRTPIKGLYLASASAHPGGGVHGIPGAGAAAAALRSRRR